MITTAFINILYYAILLLTSPLQFISWVIPDASPQAFLDIAPYIQFWNIFLPVDTIIDMVIASIIVSLTAGTLKIALMVISFLRGGGFSQD